MCLPVRDGEGESNTVLACDKCLHSTVATVLAIFLVHLFHVLRPPPSLSLGHVRPPCHSVGFSEAPALTLLCPARGLLRREHSSEQLGCILC